MSDGPYARKIMPYLYYEDGNAALAFLCDVFGFEERMVVRRGDGQLMHAEVEQGGNILLLGTPLDDEGKPKRVANLPERHACVMAYVDDVDAHFAHAEAAGAVILTQLEDQDYGSRTYSAADPEGQVWFFGSEL